MDLKNRQTLLKVVAIGVVGLFLLDKIVISPATDHWKDQSTRIDALRDKVDRGDKLLARQNAIHARWSEMLRNGLSKDNPTAENDAFKAINRWARDSRVTFTNLTPNWRIHDDEGYDALECRASATGDQITLSRFLYEMEVDPMPVALLECEMVTRDPAGQLLTMNVRFSFIRITKTGTETASALSGAAARSSGGARR